MRHFDMRLKLQVEKTDPKRADHVTCDAAILVLAHKRTECLAPELCGLPAIDRLPALGERAPCGGPGKSC